MYVRGVNYSHLLIVTVTWLKQVQKQIFNLIKKLLKTFKEKNLEIFFENLLPEFIGRNK